MRKKISRFTKSLPTGVAFPGPQKLDKQFEVVFINLKVPKFPLRYSIDAFESTVDGLNT
jgi:hypothetical protein